MVEWVALGSGACCAVLVADGTSDPPSDLSLARSPGVDLDPKCNVWQVNGGTAVPYLLWPSLADIRWLNRISQVK